MRDNEIGVGTQLGQYGLGLPEETGSVQLPVIGILRQRVLHQVSLSQMEGKKAEQGNQKMCG